MSVKPGCSGDIQVGVSFIEIPMPQCRPQGLTCIMFMSMIYGRDEFIIIPPGAGWVHNYTTRCRMSSYIIIPPGAG